MKKDIFENFTGLLSKDITIRNSLIPVGATKEHLEDLRNEDAIMDKARNQYYPILKQLLDKEYEKVINKGLDKIKNGEMIDWNQLYINFNDTKKIEKDEARTRKIIADTLTNLPEYKLLEGDAPFKSGGVIDNKDLAEDERKAVELFKGFSTHLKNFRENRKNYFSAEAKSTAVANRIVNENFRMYCSNYEILQKIVEYTDIVELISNAFEKDWIHYAEISGYNDSLSQADIDRYNEFVGKYNSVINLYCQQNKEFAENHPLMHKKNRQLRTLFKQIGCTANKLFIIDSIENDEQALDMIKAMRVTMEKNGTKAKIETICNCSAEMEWEYSKIYINSQSITDVSVKIAKVEDNGSYSVNKWSIISNALKEYWLEGFPSNYSEKKIETEINKREKEKGYSIAEISEAIQSNYNKSNEMKFDILDWFKYILELVQKTKEKDDNIDAFIDGFNNDYDLKTMDISPIKEWCDTWTDVIRCVKSFVISKDKEQDVRFYGNINEIIGEFEDFVSLYNKLRNYITQKPYKTDKYFIKFNNPQLTDGWSVDKEREYGAVLLRRKGKYFLALFNNKRKKYVIPSSDIRNSDTDYEKMEYHLFKDVSKMIPKCSTQMKAVREHFECDNDDYTVRSDSYDAPFTITKSDFRLNNVEYDGKKMWQKDYIKQHPDKEEEYRKAVKDWNAFCMRFLNTYSNTSFYDYSTLKPLDEYESVSDFYNDVDKILYKIGFCYIKEETINQYVDSGDLFLFQIYNKDFSDSKQKGSKKNLHTLYWEALFSKTNIEQGIIKLNGGAEIFRRPGSIKNKVVHKAGEVLVNKRTIDTYEPIPNSIYMDLVRHFNGRDNQVTDYERMKPYLTRVGTFTKKIDLIKDKRFTEDKYEVHIPLSINYKASTNFNFNARVLQTLKDNPNVNIIGLDRGERNLITYTLINREGKILKQGSFNEIQHMNYQQKLAQCEKDRNTERKTWQNVENIKELKEGYISQVVHELITMMIENNAIIVMEDLNYGFKRGRFRIERQVYQKFEIALLNKLQYVVTDKSDDFSLNEPGTALKGYQLTDNGNNSKTQIGKQCGFVFYIPAAYTSKIDPITGFVNVFDMSKVSSRETRKTFFESFDDIFYDVERDLFGFSFDYKKFATHQKCARTEWTVYSVGSRYVFNTRKRTDELINPTEKLKQLFEQYGINYHQDLFAQIKKVDVSVTNANFWSQLDFCFQTVLKLRNSNAEKDIDQIISPVMGKDGTFFETPLDKSTVSEEQKMPIDADTNGAYHIALKGNMVLDKLDVCSMGDDGRFPGDIYQITHPEWLAYRQK